MVSGSISRKYSPSAAPSGVNSVGTSGGKSRLGSVTSVCSGGSANEESIEMEGGGHGIVLFDGMVVGLCSSDLNSTIPLSGWSNGSMLAGTELVSVSGAMGNVVGGSGAFRVFAAPRTHASISSLCPANLIPSPIGSSFPDFGTSTFPDPKRTVGGKSSPVPILEMSCGGALLTNAELPGARIPSYSASILPTCARISPDNVLFG